jgi:predicted N-acetyltransferase YhbS
MLIRRETPQEFSQIYDLVKIAFQTAKVSDGREQEFVNQLRSSNNYIPELALVAEEDGRLIGHIMLTKTTIKEGDVTHEALLLAPISVVLAFRNKGVGSSLISESFRLAREMGYSSVFLVGDPAYYTRFGFRKTVDFGVQNTNGIPDEYVMACELVPGALAGINGTIEFETPG